jgi:hypothetical protein
MASQENIINQKDIALLVIDDAGLGFRDHPEIWPRVLKSNKEKPWIILKMAHPVVRGDLWEHLVENHADRLITILTVNDLRRSEVQISREYSWERTAQDLAWELIYNPQINLLAHCACTIISYDTAGAFLLSRLNNNQKEKQKSLGIKLYLFFDPQHFEGSWALDYPGYMIGYTSCLTASIARELLLNQSVPDIKLAMQSGLRAMRRLHSEGYGNRSSAVIDIDLKFPKEHIVSEIEKTNSIFSEVEVPIPVHKLSDGKPTIKEWDILEDRYSQLLDHIAPKIAIEGLESTIKDVPIAKFGNFITVDRSEIESFRGLRTIIKEYCQKSRNKSPLSIAVFGSPGSGKSFAVHEVTKSLFPELIKKIEFNLSQLNGPEELSAAFHQVRDIVLSGSIPIVFWDEFDTLLQGQAYGWLRYFLSPMQDGKFQDGHITYSIGNCIFVFAGGMNVSMEQFTRVLSSEEFHACKGTDFISRLKGNVNIVGPNARNGDLPGDPHFIIRRAIMLRTLLNKHAPHLFSHKEGKYILNIDSGILHAFLHIGCYKHGVRSMESIITMCMLSNKQHFERSCLPSEEQINLHVDGHDFYELIKRMVLNQETVEILSEAVHNVFLESKQRSNWKYNQEKNEKKKTHPLILPYDQIPEWAKEANRENARTIIQKLENIGYAIVPSKDEKEIIKFSREEIERLAEIEHNIWMRSKIQDGFKLGKPTKEDPLRNEYLVDWSKLPENIKQIDRDLVAAIPIILKKAGYTVIRVVTK